MIPSALVKVGCDVGAVRRLAPAECVVSVSRRRGVVTVPHEQMSNLGVSAS